MTNPIRPALDSQRGFSLTEMLLALALFVILTGMVAMGIPVATRTYTRAVDGSNAQTLLSTATTTLRDELSLATGTMEVGDQRYYEDALGQWCRLETKDAGTTDARIVKQVYKSAEGGSGPDTTAMDGEADLITAAAITDSLGLSFEGELEYDSANDLFRIRGLQVIGPGDASLASIPDEVGGVYEVKAVMLEERA